MALAFQRRSSVLLWLLLLLKIRHRRLRNRNSLLKMLQPRRRSRRRKWVFPIKRKGWSRQTVIICRKNYDGVSVTARSRPIVLIRRPSSLGRYPVTATSAVRVFAAARRAARRTVGDRAFAAAGPTLWNSLPLDITDCVSLASFCAKLKTSLFSISFP